VSLDPETPPAEILEVVRERAVAVILDSFPRFVESIVTEVMHELELTPEQFAAIGEVADFQTEVMGAILQLPETEDRR
jgi:hypothetical protein